MHQQREPLLRALAHLPRHHPFAIAGFCMALVIVLLGAGLYEAHEEINVQRTQITNVVRQAALCNPDSLRNERESKRCADRIRIGVINCRRDQACRRALEGKPPLRADE